MTFDPSIMGGRPCIKGTRVTVATVLGLVADGLTADTILADYPYLSVEDIRAARLCRMARPRGGRLSA
ncbi:MAG: DUF433 domain-containing protein [Geminicoccaceae bacterium]